MKFCYLAVPLALVAATGIVQANSDVSKGTSPIVELGDAGWRHGTTSATASSVRSIRQCRQDAGGVDLLDLVLRGHEDLAVIGDMMYIHSAFSEQGVRDGPEHPDDQMEVRAEAGSGVIPQMCCDTGGIARGLCGGKVFLRRLTARWWRLDARTGKVVWSVKNGGPSLGAVNTNAPHIFKNKVITGFRRRMGRARIWPPTTSTPVRSHEGLQHGPATMRC